MSNPFQAGRFSARNALRSETARLLRGSGFIFCCRVAGAAFTFASQILLARSIGASELGVYALAFSWCLLLANLSTLGFIPAAMRFIGKSHAEQSVGYARGFIVFASRTTTASSLAISIALGLACLFVISEDSPIRLPLLIAAGAIPMLAGLHLLGGFGNAYSNFALGFLPTSVLRPGLFCLLVLAAWVAGIELDANTAMWLSAAAIMAVSLPSFAYGIRFVKQRIGGTTSIRDSSWFATSASLLAAALFTGYFPEIIIIVAGTVLPSDELAVLHVSLRLSMLVSFGLLAVDTFAGPDIARLLASGDLIALQRTVSRATRLRFWGSLLAAAIYAIAGVPLLELFGPDFAAGYPILMVLVIGQLVQGSVGPVVRLMGISSHQNQALIVFGVSLTVAILLTLLLAPALGALGAAIAATLVTAGWGIWMRHLVVKLIGVTPRIF